jgi:hypothetical protein
MTNFLLYLGIGIGTLSLAFGWTQTELPLMGLIPLALLPFWLFTLRRKLPWASALGLGLLTALSALGVGRGLSFGYALAAVLGGLVAWDLDNFARRLRHAAQEDKRDVLERAHLLQIALILLLSGGIVGLSLAAQVQFNFNWAVGAVLVTVGGLGALVNWLRKREG